MDNKTKDALKQIAEGKRLSESSSVSFFSRKSVEPKVAGYEIKPSKELDNLALLKGGVEARPVPTREIRAGSGEKRKRVKVEAPNTIPEDKWVVVKINLNEEIADKFRLEHYETIRRNMNLVQGEDSLGYILFVILKNMEKDYLSKYGELHAPTLSDVSLYSKRQVKGLDYPENYFIDFSHPKPLVFRIRREDLDLLHLLMHNFYLNNSEIFKGKRFTKNIFFIEIMKFVGKKNKSLKKFNR